MRIGLFYFHQAVSAKMIAEVQTFNEQVWPEELEAVENLTWRATKFLLRRFNFQLVLRPSAREPPVCLFLQQFYVVSDRSSTLLPRTNFVWTTVCHARGICWNFILNLLTLSDDSNSCDSCIPASDQRDQRKFGHS